jgi:hypothetical protein
MQNLNKSKQVLDSGGSLKLPGEADPDVARIVQEYLDRFHCVIHLGKDKFNHKELYKWCSDHLGEKYKDWFIYEGGAQDRVWAIQIRSPKHSTFFRLKWNDAIVKSFDKHIE